MFSKLPGNKGALENFSSLHGRKMSHAHPQNSTFPVIHSANQSPKSYRELAIDVELDKISPRRDGPNYIYKNTHEGRIMHSQVKK